MSTTALQCAQYVVDSDELWYLCCSADSARRRWSSGLALWKWTAGFDVFCRCTGSSCVVYNFNCQSLWCRFYCLFHNIISSLNKHLFDAEGRTALWMFKATSLGVSPSTQVAVVGVTSGHVHFVDLTSIKQPRVVQVTRLHHNSVRHIVWVQLLISLLYCLLYFVWLYMLLIFCIWNYLTLNVLNRALSVKKTLKHNNPADVLL